MVGYWLIELAWEMLRPFTLFARVLITCDWNSAVRYTFEGGRHRKASVSPAHIRIIATHDFQVHRHSLHPTNNIFCKPLVMTGFQSPINSTDKPNDPSSAVDIASCPLRRSYVYIRSCFIPRPIKTTICAAAATLTPGTRMSIASLNLKCGPRHAVH